MPPTELLRPPIGGPGAKSVVSAPGELEPFSESWSELLPDVFVLPAAVEAAQATADEGPGPWPPVIPDDPPDDPTDAPAVAPRATAAVPATPPCRGPLQTLARFLRQVKTRRSTVVSEYSVE
jgi:hypothetical protein